jgi:hypothetical protein
METKSEPDPVIDEIREERHRISARFNHDPERLVAYYTELQEQYRDRLIDGPPKERKGRPAA